ncbi:MAG: hypothetical protein U0670_04500 [Anaerolineae bacterium]
MAVWVVVGEYRPDVDRAGDVVMFARRWQQLREELDRRRKLARRWQQADTIALLVLATAALILFEPYLTPPHYLMPNSALGTDLTREVVPLMAYLRDTVEQTGELPLWRTYALSGAPLFGNPINPALYPVHWIVLIFPLPLALNFDILLHVLIAGIGVYLSLALIEGVRPAAALTGALLFELAPRLIQHISGGHWWLVSSLAWMPVAWFLFSAYWRTRRTPWAIGLGIVLALQAMNDGKYLAITGIALAACTVGFVLPDVKRSLRDGVRLWGLALVVMLGLSAPVVLPVAALLPYSHRSLLTAEEALSSVPLPLLVGAFLPDTLRFTETYLYAGIGSLVLPFALMTSRLNRRERWWVIGAGVALLLSLGTNGLLYPILYDGVPGFHYLRDPARFYPLALFALAMLAGLAVERWHRYELRGRLMRPVLIGLSAVYLLVQVVAFFMPLPLIAFPHALIAPLIAVILVRRPSQRAWLLLFAFLLVDLLWVDRSLNVPVEPTTFVNSDDRVIRYLQEHMDEDERILDPYAVLTDSDVRAAGLNSAGGYDVAQMIGYRDALNAAIGCDFEGYSVGAPPMRASAEAVRTCPQVRLDRAALRRLNVRYVILPQVLNNAQPVFRDGQRFVYEITGLKGRAWSESDAQAAFSACPDDAPSSLPTEFSTVTIEQHQRTVNGERFRVSASQSPALLIRSEAWAPGAQVLIDGEPAAMVRAYCALQAVVIPPGDGAAERTIEFVYDPPYFELGLTLSAVTLGGVGGYVLMMILRRRRTPRTQGLWT